MIGFRYRLLMGLKSTLLKVPIIRKLVLREVGKMQPTTNGSLTWRGNYKDWAEALKDSHGYDQVNILNSVKNAILQVKAGTAVYERDGVVFDRIHYSWPLITFLLKIALENQGALNVVDYGGSLGSSYFQNKELLNLGSRLHWNVIEQRHFVECGKSCVEDESLKFYYDIESCPADQKKDVLLLSGVLSYLENPYDTIDYLNSLHFNYVIIDRNAFVKSDEDLLKNQVVAEDVSYPTWFFNRVKLLQSFSNYKLVLEFEDNTTKPVIINNKECYWAGLILKKQLIT
jgi:putative methyltransferase (TIGR04325 family)